MGDKKLRSSILGLGISPACSLALYGWPMWDHRMAAKQVPCPGFIESDYAPGTFYPCVTCNQGWSRICLPEQVVA